MLRGDEVQQNVRKRLLSPEPWKNQKIPYGSQSSGTASWWTQRDTHTGRKSAQVRSYGFTGNVGDLPTYASP